MLKFLAKWSEHIWLAIMWSLITLILLCLPGSVLPSHGLFSLPFIDKIAHLGLFGGLVFFWSLYYYFHRRPNIITVRLSWTIVFCSFLFGVIMEFVQENFIPNRSFDVGDIIADLAGSLIGYLITHWYIRLQTVPKN
jgi:VanZ family protein